MCEDGISMVGDDAGQPAWDRHLGPHRTLRETGFYHNRGGLLRLRAGLFDETEFLF